MSSTLIIGGGIIGLLSAIELHEAGEQVCVVDRQQAGQESSWAGGGILSPLYPWRYPDAVTILARFSQQLYTELIKKLQQRTDMDAEYLHSGMLVLGDYEEAADWVKTHAIDSMPVERERIQQIAPEINSHYQSGWWFPAIHQVRNPRLMAVIKAYIKTTDICLIEHQTIDSFDIRQQRITAAQAAGRRFEADRFLVAGGAWSNQLVKPIGLDIGVRPVKGQMLLLQGEPGLVKRITLSEDRYIIPRRDGRVLVGSTTENAGFDKSTSSQIRQQLLDYAVHTIPALKNSRLEKHWAGLRPGTDSGIPRIGAHPDFENLFLNCGHYRNGLVMAAGSARLLAQIMSGQTPSIEAECYQP